VLDVYRNQKANVTLIDHLRTNTESNLNTYQFHFPVFNLEIEAPFKIGNTEFKFFTKEHWDNYYKSLQEKKPTDEESFDEIFRKDFQGQVLAKVTVTAERDKAEEIAKIEAENSVNVLKLYGITPAIPERKTMFDLNFRLNYQVKTIFLSQNVDEKDGLALNLKFQNPPYEFYKEHFLSANQRGLQTFSHYLKLKKDNELYNLVIQAIGFIGSALSNWDLHLRCVNLITTLESLLLKDDEKGDLEQKAKARLSKIISDDFKEKEKIKSIFSNIYQVRHKMIHKAKRITINTKELAQAQIIMINLLLKLMRFNIAGNHTGKAMVIEELNKIKS